MHDMAETLREPLVYAREVVGKDPLAQYLGIEVEAVDQGYAKVSLTIRPEYLNAAERAHGTIIYAAADQAFAVASNSTGNMALSINFNINYLSAAINGEKIFAEASPVNIGRKVSSWQIQVRGSEDRLIATGQGIAYHK